MRLQFASATVETIGAEMGAGGLRVLIPYTLVGVAVLVYQDPFLLHGIPITIANLPFDHAVQRKPQTMC